MPRGVRKAVVQGGDGPAISVAPDAQLTGQSVIESAGKVARSRDEIEADKWADEYLRDNRMNLVGHEMRLPPVPDRPGWVRRWVNDVGSRIPSLIDRGWKLVQRGAAPDVTNSMGRGNTDIGGGVSVVSTMGEGPVNVRLMEIPKRLYDLQMEAIHEPVRQTEKSIRAGRTGLNDAKHVYTPEWANHGIETSQ